MRRRAAMICSISKLFTAVAAMRLVDEHRLQLDDELGSVLPGFKLAQSDPDSAPVTLRALLTHSAGLPRESDFPDWTGPDFVFPTTPQIRDRLAGQPTSFRSGERFEYSNLGMTASTPSACCARTARSAPNTASNATPPASSPGCDPTATCCREWNRPSAAERRSAGARERRSARRGWMQAPSAAP